MIKSAFGSKRKARKIQVDDDEEIGKKDSQGTENITPSSASSNPNRKAFKKSSLRQSIAFDDGDENEQDNRPTIGRSSSLMKKKKPAASRLSFGPGEIISGDAAEALEDDEMFTPKKATLGRRVVEGNALRRSLPYQGLPVRSNEDDEERPTYSKDYLNELKSSTPTTPKDLQALHATAEDEEMLDASELEGATVVEAEPSAAYIPTEAEIKEKKERRARLAHEKDFISLNDDGDDRRQISLLPRKREKETRLVREDEDLGEGFDEFVDDGRISLGKKAEREARKRQRKEMADMIHQAEGSSEDESDDSEAERRAAYEAAQTRAGMDGLHKPEDLDRSTVQMPSKITPLPNLSECLERLQNTLTSMELELAKRQTKLEESKQEKLDIGKREAEVQELLKQAGSRYAALKADTNGAVADPQATVDAQNSGFVAPLMVDRGLESFGNTPIARLNMEDVG
ncbi:hypothetical protein BDZ45DRAFT_721051 [Acephala macrosclerotiorum]|nr:hypothetical protein BDZ45DRAFT_721051 [Acephala macrosclerotiorum]